MYCWSVNDVGFNTCGLNCFVWTKLLTKFKLLLFCFSTIYKTAEFLSTLANDISGACIDVVISVIVYGFVIVNTFLTDVWK